MWTEVRTRHLVDNRIVEETIWYFGMINKDILSVDWRFRAVPKARLQSAITAYVPKLLTLSQDTLASLRSTKS